jgi:hypothetical protein
MTHRCLIHQPGAMGAIRRGLPGIHVCPTDPDDCRVFVAVGDFAYPVYDAEGQNVGEGETMIRLRHLDGSDAEPMSAWHLHALRRVYENPESDTADDLAAMRELGRE